MWNEREKVAEWMRTLIDGVNEGWLCQYVGKAFFFDQVSDAHAYIEARKNIGKVVLIP
jgi:NADPH:quinone reductase-like Zn-dependent oxidoreductase